MTLDSPEGGVEYPIASFTQPPAAFLRTPENGKEYFELNPDAENLDNLSGGLQYYSEQIASLRIDGKIDEIKSQYCLLDAEAKTGKAVWPMFDVKKHVARERIDPIPGAPLLIGCDPSGIHPAAVLAQYQQGRWCVIDELFGEQQGLEVFMNSGLIPLVSGRYPRSEVTISCDPANARDAYTGLAPTAHFQKAGFTIAARTTNKPETRIAAVASLLNIDVGGLLISPHCENLIEAMKGGDGPTGYHYSRYKLRGSINVAYSSIPEKNEASHLADALQYLCMHINRESHVDTPDAWKLKQVMSKRNALRHRIMMN
jgi:hypothetical protein